MQGLGVSSNWACAPVAILPRLPEHHVPRGALAAAVRDGRQRLTLLCAPAGYGKTVLLCESFAGGAAGENLLWLSCRGQVPGLAELCSKIALALGFPAATGPVQLLRLLGLPGRPLRLVLDDLAGDLCLELNNWFEQLLHLPECRVRLCVSCRQRPAWDLPSLLLRGDLLELGVAQLCMSHRDYEAVCCRIAADADEAQREDIWLRCGGWWGAACLLLAGNSQGRTLLRDYLQREVLVRLTDGERRVFHGLCHLPRFSAELCAQLWEAGAGAQALGRLLHLQVFIQPLDAEEHWYRVQPLVASLLHDAIAPDELARLRLHACRLLSLAGQLHDAIDQALRARQPEVAATYMERLKPSWQLADRHLRRVLEWRRQLPGELLEGTPRLIYLSSLALLLSGRVGEAELSLAGLSRFLPAATAEHNRLLLAHWQALAGGIQAFRGELDGAERHCREALANLRDEPRDWLSHLLCQFTLGRVLQASGRVREAQTHWHAALEQARRQGCQDSEALLQGECLRGLMLAGELELAGLLLEDGLQGRAQAGLDWDPVLGRLMLTRADLLLAQGAVEDADLALRAALPHLRDCDAPFVLGSYLGLAEVAGRRGNLALAQAQVRRGERAMQCAGIDRHCYQPALALQQLKGLAQQRDWRGVLEAGGLLAGQYPVGGALSTLLSPTLSLEVQWLVAQAEHHLGRREQAAARLRVIVEHCGRSGFGQLRAEALRFRQQQEIEEEGADAGGYQEELTAREAAVLERLAEGLSNQEIADALFLSVNTVKYHAKNINAKLGTSRRTQAIAFAKARGLLA